MPEILTRSEWGAKTPLGHAMKLPAREVWVHHSVTSGQVDPVAGMRELERIGTARFGRFSYSWVFWPNGVIGEGAGTTIGAHTKGANSTSFGFCWAGNFERDQPTTMSLDSAVWLIRELIRSGELIDGIHPAGGHRDRAQTACPGTHLYARIPLLRSLVAAGPAPVPQEGPVQLRYPDNSEVQLDPPPTWLLHVGEDTLIGVSRAGHTYCMGVDRDRLAQSVYSCGYTQAWFDGTERQVADAAWVDGEVHINSDRGELYRIPANF